MSEAVKPYYTLINTSRGDDPAVVVVNSALRQFRERERFPWNLRIEIQCRDLLKKGMPTREESLVLQELEESISDALQLQDNAIFAARITCAGRRELLFRIHDPELANDQLQKLTNNQNPRREWEYKMEEDHDWVLIRPELVLLEKDPKFN
jgi:hypothetical protein